MRYYCFVKNSQSYTTDTQLYIDTDNCHSAADDALQIYLENGFLSAGDYIVVMTKEVVVWYKVMLNDYGSYICVFEKDDNSIKEFTGWIKSDFSKRVKVRTCDFDDAAHGIFGELQDHLLEDSNSEEYIVVTDGDKVFEYGVASPIEGDERNFDSKDGDLAKDYINELKEIYEKTEEKMDDMTNQAAILGIELAKSDNPAAVENALVKFSLLDYKYPNNFELAKYNDLRYKASNYVRNNVECKTYFLYVENQKDETYCRVDAFSKENAVVKILFQYRDAGFTLTDIDKIYVERWEKFRANEIVGVFNKDLKEFYGPWPQTPKKEVFDGNSKNSPNNSTKSYRCNHVLNRPCAEIQASSPEEAAAVYAKNSNLTTPCDVHVDDMYYAVKQSAEGHYYCKFYFSDPWLEEPKWKGPFCFPSNIPFSKSYTSLGQEVGALVDEKQKQYGDSFSKAHVILASLYPDGVRPDQYTDMLACVRIIDKLFRIAQRKQDGQDLGGESPYRDIAGYGLLGLKKDNDVTDKPSDKVNTSTSNACNFDDTDADVWDRDE